MTNVYLLIHEDVGEYDSCDEVRGIYHTAAAANADVVTRTPSGRRSTALGAHSDRCCRVEEREVQIGVDLANGDSATYRMQIDQIEEDPGWKISNIELLSVDRHPDAGGPES